MKGKKRNRGKRITGDAAKRYPVRTVEPVTARSANDILSKIGAENGKKAP